MVENSGISGSLHFAAGSVSPIHAFQSHIARRSKAVQK